jgi:hypothetical protein
MIDRRAMVFAVAAFVCLALIPAADVDLRYVPRILAVWYAVLAALSQLDHSSRRRRYDDARATSPARSDTPRRAP